MNVFRVKVSNEALNEEQLKIFCKYENLTEQEYYPDNKSYFKTCVKVGARFVSGCSFD